MAKKSKTHKAIAKRFRITKKGKVMHRSQYDNSHLKTKKSHALKARQKRMKKLANKTQIKKIKAFLH